MNAVGIDISKGNSTVAVLRPLGKVALAPRGFVHTYTDMSQLVDLLGDLDGETRVVMEATGRYHEPVAAALHQAGFYVSVLNPILIHQSGGGSVRKVKSDKKDALKIAKYGLDNWADLRQYSPMDNKRQQLKLFSRQYNLYMKTIVSLQNNLISLLDKTFPGVNELFTSPERADGHRKWVDFVASFWHCECVCGLTEKAFTARYQKCCKRSGYNFSKTKAADIYAFSGDLFATLPKDDNSKLLISSAVAQLNASIGLLATIKAEVIRLSKLLPEYDTVIAMYGVGDITAAQLMAEIGYVRRFANRGSLVGFAGIDPEVNQSGKQNVKSTSTTKRGSPYLRKTLFQVVSTYLKLSPADEPVYQFLDKKRSEGKPFYVFMTAAANKFLRIYYARVKECLAILEDK